MKCIKKLILRIIKMIRVRKEEGHYTIKIVDRLPKKGNANWMYAIEKEETIEEVHIWTLGNEYKTIKIGAGEISNIQAGDNITITGIGTDEDPLIISSTTDPDGFVTLDTVQSITAQKDFQQGTLASNTIGLPEVVHRIRIDNKVFAPEEQIIGFLEQGDNVTGQSGIPQITATEFSTGDWQLWRDVQTDRYPYSLMLLRGGPIGNYRVALSSQLKDEAASQISSRLQVGYSNAFPDKLDQNTLSVNGNIHSIEVMSTGASILDINTKGNTALITKEYGDANYSGGGGINNIVEDITPQLGGDLDVNNKNIIELEKILFSTGGQLIGNNAFDSAALIGNDDFGLSLRGQQSSGKVISIDSSQVYTNLSNAEIDATGATSLITKGYFDTNSSDHLTDSGSQSLTTKTLTGTTADTILFTEDFEGVFDPKFTFDGDLPWTIVGGAGNGGGAAAVSGAIGFSETTGMILTITTTSDVSTLTYDFAQSSEDCCDYVTVYLNGIEILSEKDNNTSYAPRSIDLLGAKEHVIKWEYHTDSNTTGGTDNAHIDNIAIASNISDLLFDLPTSYDKGVAYNEAVLMKKGFTSDTMIFTPSINNSGIINTGQILADGKDAGNNIPIGVSINSSVIAANSQQRVFFASGQVAKASTPNSALSTGIRMYISTANSAILGDPEPFGSIQLGQAGKQNIQLNAVSNAGVSQINSRLQIGYDSQFVPDLANLNVLAVNGNTSIEGNVIVTGTVDGIDIATDVAANTSKTGVTTEISNLSEDITPQLGGELDLNGHSVGGDPQTATGDGTTTIDWKLGNVFNFQFGAFNEAFTFTAPSKAGTFMLKLVQDSVGSRTVSFPGSVKWSGGVAPTLTTTATTGTDIITFYFDGTNYFGTEVLNFS